MRGPLERRGFTLVEALAAFAILVLVMSGLLQGIGGGARNDARADFLLRAAREGRSQLEALGVAAPIVIGEQTGRYDDGLLWRLVVEPYREAATAGGLGERTRAYLARVTVRRPGERAADVLTLTTIKLTSTRERP